MSTDPSQARESVWTPANVVTTIRAVLIPLWMVLAGLAVAVFYILLSATDKLDGYLARSRNEVTVFGKFLDPIADKLVVVTALLYLIEQGLVPVWMVFVIVAREFVISGVRMVVATEGVVIAASNLGKYKTASTMTSISGYLVWLALPAGPIAEAVWWASLVLMWVAVALTAWSGVDYVVKSKDYLLKG